MTQESLPHSARAVIPAQTHTLSRDERLQRGKALREVTARTAQREWNPPANRPDPVELLIENSKGRLEELLPIRYGRMAASPFAFYRGAAAIMASDLACTPATGLTVVADGDCHLLNFGGFATAERQLIFDINDFDEVSVAPWEWDIKRLAASFFIAGQSNGFDRRLKKKPPGWRRRVTVSAWRNTARCRSWRYGMTALTSRKSSRKFRIKKPAASTVRNWPAPASRAPMKRNLRGWRISLVILPRIQDDPPLIFHYGGKRRRISSTRPWRR